MGVVKAHPSIFILVLYYARAYAEQMNEARSLQGTRGIELQLNTSTHDGADDPRINVTDYIHLKQVLQHCMRGEMGPTWQEYKDKKRRGSRFSMTMMQQNSSHKASSKRFRLG